jgi:dihydrolipoamide dehydrogenase
MATIEVKVPDIGDFEGIPVIEILVKPGDTVAKEDSLVTLESDKATMEVPSSHAGVVKAIQVKVGDKVSKGTALLTIETSAEASAPAAPPKAAAPPAAAPASAAAAPCRRRAQAFPRGAARGAQVHAREPRCRPARGSARAGIRPGGYTAAFRSADLGKKVVLVERYPVIGGVCLNVGCIPSKALLHAAKVIADAEEMEDLGVTFGHAKIDLDRLRKFKDDVVGKLTKGLASMAKGRKVTVVTGRAAFASAHTLEVETAEGKKTISFDNCIIAAGSQSAQIPGFPYDDPRLMDSTGALELKDVPKRILIIGGGIIGLEMATVYDALGSKVTVVEFLDRPHPRGGPGHREAAPPPHREALREDPAQDEGREARIDRRRPQGHVRERGRCDARARRGGV